MLIDEFGGRSRVDIRRGKASPLVADAFYHIGASYHATASFEKSADAYEEYAFLAPDEPRARDALQEATRFRLGLGQHDEALANARLFEQRYGQRYAVEAAAVVLAVGSAFIERGQWAESVAHHRAFVTRYRGGASADVQVRGMVALGYSLWKLDGNHRAEAVRHLAEALTIADQERSDDEPRLVRRERYRAMIVDSEPEAAGAGPDRRLALMVEAVAKARFYLAEGQLESFVALDRSPFSPSRGIPPAVRAWWVSREGRAKVASIERGVSSLPPRERLQWITFIQFEHWFVTWMEARGAARERAQSAYVEAAAEGVPGWEIAAAARVGDMFRSEMEAHLDLPIPAAIAQDPDLLDTYQSALDRRAEEFRELAIGAYQRCLRVSTRTRWFDERSRHCEHNLNALSPRDFPLADELRSDPGCLPEPMAEPGFIREGE
jgi:hypothetical protein